ncbi:hypothetical protein CPC16_010572 [Podila verticillata]|nr:hypothetical protein CPC16_010572 [Podila verticillata]
MKHTIVPSSVLALALALMIPTHAQIYGQYVYNNNRLYLADLGNNTYSESFRSLDLSGPWPAKPVWSSAVVQPKRSADILAPIALNKEWSKLYFFDFDGYQPYNLQTSAWEAPVTKLDIGGYALGPVTDTDSGLMYSTTVPDKNRQVSLTTFDPSSDGAPSVVLAVPTSTSWLDHGVYNSVRKSLFFLAIGAHTDLYEFHPTTKNWTAVIAVGEIPGPRMGACFASAGSKLIVAGGTLTSSPISLNPADQSGSTDVYQFDIESLIWTKSASSPIGRNGGGCAVSGDSLILFGGRGSGMNATLATDYNTLSVYNLKTNTWSTSEATSASGSPGGQETKSSAGKLSLMSGSLATLLAMVLFSVIS